MGQITLQGVRKSFGPVNIIKDANLDIEDGAFVVFVGPSGCGKTTLLRLIAGLEDVTGGQILIDGRNVVDVPPAKRGLSMVFQSYALYPHMSGPRQYRVRPENGRLPRPEIDRKVEAAAATLNLTPYLTASRATFPADSASASDRTCHLCASEGVFVRRALCQSRAALRVQMRLRSPSCKSSLGHRRLRHHDQVEAMTMADKIVVLNAGRIEQYGSPLGTV